MVNTTGKRAAGLMVWLACFGCVCAVGTAGELLIERSTMVEGDAEWDWTQARTAMVPGDARFFLTTMSRTKKTGAHGYHDIYVVYSDDDGGTWSEPAVVPTLKRSRQSDGYEVVVGDLWPIWHAASGKVFVTGKTFNFAEGTKENHLRERVAYCGFDPATRVFGLPLAVRMPEADHGGQPFIAANAGCNQQVVLDGGDVLLPIRYLKSESPRNYTSIVARCAFNGTTLRHVEYGTEHSIPTGRGLYEPSVTAHAGAYYLTLRADDGAYVARSEDGIHYTEHVPWRFDDGEPLGSYNTQQHWVTLGGKLYLVYTRRGADNDHIMRHRAPLFIAEVDSERLVVMRATEQVAVPENHATLGNSGICRVSDDESWITVAEGRVAYGERKGENNRVILARLRAQP